MNRLGFRVEDFPTAWSRLRTHARVQQLRVMTHLADADNQDGARTPQQIAQFMNVVSDLNVERSVGNSAGLVAWPDARLEWVRPGLMLYGMSPFPNSTAVDLNLRAAMTLVTPLIALRTVLAGEEVGYGGTWCAASTTRVGIAAVGYGDGYPRQARIGTPVCINGQIRPIVGRVSMDMIAIDLGMELPAESGTPVIIWGQGLPAEQVATFADTIPYELVCAMSQRVAMQYR